MATQRKDGRFMSRAKDRTGKTIYGYGKTAGDADADLAAKLSATPLTGQTSSFHDVAKSLWYPGLDSVKPLTRKRYEGIYVRWIRPVAANIPIAEFKLAHARAIITRAQNGGNSAGSLQIIRAVLSQILRLAVIEGYIAQNYASFLKLPPLPERRVRVLTVESATALLDLVAGTEMAAPVFLAAVLGLRRGEIAGLKWCDLDRQRGELTICRQRQAIRPKGVIETDLKTRSSRRVLRLTPGFIAEIDARGNLDSPYICTFRGLPWVPDTIGEHWAKVRVEAGLPDWHFHDLRHGSAGLLYAAGCDILQIAAVLGHAKPDMSLVYTDSTAEKQGEGLALLGASLGF
jgi:integrase